MNATAQVRENPTSKPPVTHVGSNLLQRKCACGGKSGLDGECTECRKKRLQRRFTNQAAPSTVSSIVPEGLSSSGQLGSWGAHNGAEPGYGHDFGRVWVRPPETAIAQTRLPNSQLEGARSKLAPETKPTSAMSGMFSPAKSAGRMSVRSSRSSSSKGDITGSRPGESQDEQTIMSASTAGNRIDFTFDPTTSSPTPNCDEIVIVQSILMRADGSAIMPGTYYTPWTCRSPAALGDGTYIDHDCPCITPYYTYCFNGTAGASNSVTRNATSIDAPQTAGGDKGFRSAANPTGWATVTYNFETYAFCAAGTDCGVWYDGVEWNYTKTAADHAAGRNGIATGTASLLPPDPGSTVVTAFNHFNSVKGFVPCRMSVRPRVP